MTCDYDEIFARSGGDVPADQVRRIIAMLDEKNRTVEF